MTSSHQPDFVCACGYGARTACKGEPFFNGHEGRRYCVLHYPGKDKIDVFRTALKRKLDATDFDFRDVWFPETVDFVEFNFSFDAIFSGATFSQDVSFYKAIFSARASFDSVTFNSHASFDSTTFSKDITFSKATFNAHAGFDNAKFAIVESVDNIRFESTTFNATSNFNRTIFRTTARFDETTFCAALSFDFAAFMADARFDFATFSESSSFIRTKFNKVAGFHSAIYCQDACFDAVEFGGEARFDKTTFKTDASFDSSIFNSIANFDQATLKNYVYFAGLNNKRKSEENTSFSFQFAHFEKPERVSFHTLDLRPHWFVNVDSRKFEFTDVKFNYILVDELASLKERGVSAPHRLLAIACRQLADNAEANHRYGEASELRFSAFEARRLEKPQPPFPWQIEWWHRSAILVKKTLERTFAGIAPWRLEWWYWLASGYGESVGHAFFIFVLLLSLFAFGYKAADFDPLSKTAITQLEQAASSSEAIPARLSWSEAVRYSVNVALLQKPEPKPRGDWNWLVTAETILGPAQAALLALAVRRRFMR